jgi:membrane protein DedA with SNARE-associated domain
MFDWITQLIGRAGYAGIALLMFLENVFPPIPSWLVMPLAGFEASSGRFSPILVVICGTIGSTAGALFWYGIGRFIRTDRLKSFAGRYGHWAGISPGQLDKAGRWFNRHGASAVMVGRIVPVVRIFISIPAGLFALRLRQFVLFTAIGDSARNGALATAGYLLRSRYAEVKDYLNPVASVMLALVATTYVLRAISRQKREN